MNKQTSIYLDLLRFLAAMAVFVWHLDSNNFYNIWPDRYRLGHDAVIVFFVLSGYVISYVADTKEKDVKSYFISRFSRLYSVLIPALFLTVITDKIGILIYPQIYKDYLLTNFLAQKCIFILAFLNQIWLLNLRFITNSPLWSLSYEFWYYVLFAAAFYVKNNRFKYLLITLICLFVGPKILLLFPIWLLGSIIYNLHKKMNIKPNKALFLFILSFFLLIIHLFIFDYLLYYKGIYREILGYSAKFISSNVLGLIVALNIFSVKYLNFKSLFKHEKVIRDCASITFSMYLFHKPLMFFWGAILKHQPGNLFTFLPIVLLTLITIYVLAQYTEKKKHVFKKIIVSIWNRACLYFFENKESSTRA